MSVSLQRQIVEAPSEPDADLPALRHQGGHSQGHSHGDSLAAALALQEAERGRPGRELDAPAMPAARPRRRGWRLLSRGSGLVTGVIAVAALGTALLLRPLPQAAPSVVPPAAPVAAAPAISVVPATTGPITETAIVTGSLVAREEVLVAAQIDGYAIDQIMVEEGDHVAKGQVLARLSRSMIDTALAQNTAQGARAEAAVAQARSAIVEAQAAQAQASSAYARSEALSRSGNATADTLEQRQAASRSADARLASAQSALKVAQADQALASAQRDELLVRLDRTEIKAPTAGVVSRRTARLGAIASAAGEPLFRLIEDGSIELEANVPEATLARLHPGQPARLVTASSEAPVPARVRLVAPEVNPTTRLGRVRLGVEAQGGLTVGAFGRATVELATRTGVLVPQSAVLYAETGPQVQLVREGVVHTMPITIGLRTDTQAQVASGLKAGDQVVATAGTFVNDGDRVSPVAANAVAAK